RLALACVGGIDISRRHMAEVFRKHPALFQPHVAFLRESLDGEDVAVIEARSVLLPFHPRLAVLGDADAVAASHRHRAGPVHLETLCLIYRQRPACSVFLLQEQSVRALSDDGLIATGEAFGVLMEFDDHARRVIAHIALLRLRPARRAANHDIPLLTYRAPLL